MICSAFVGEAPPNHSLAYRVVDAVVVVVCLPFYMVAWPLFRMARARSAAALNKAVDVIICPHCSHSFRHVLSSELESYGVRLHLKPGSIVNEERMPRWSVKCRACGAQICFDAQHRVTDCNGADAISNIPDLAK